MSGEGGGKRNGQVRQEGVDGFKSEELEYIRGEERGASEPGPAPVCHLSHPRSSHVHPMWPGTTHTQSVGAGRRGRQPWVVGSAQRAWARPRDGA